VFVLSVWLGFVRIVRGCCDMANFRVLKSGYRFNKGMAKVFFGLALLLILPQLVWSLNAGFFGDGWVSFECSCEGAQVSCANPYYLNSRDVVLNSMERLPCGYVFNPVPWFYDLYQLPLIVLLLGYFVFNHYWYNKDFKGGVNEG